MRKIELEEELERLQAAILRYRRKTKRLTTQHKTDVERLEELHREASKLKRINNNLAIKHEKLRKRCKILENQVLDFTSELEEVKKQNTTLRHKVEMIDASSILPRYDVLKG